MNDYTVVYIRKLIRKTINLCLKSMPCLLLFTSRARHYVKGFMYGFLNYATYARNSRSLCLLIRRRQKISK